MKRNIGLWATAALLFCSCANDVSESTTQPIDESQYTTFMAQDGGLTRNPHIWDNNNNTWTPHWQQDDRLWLHVSENDRIGSVGNNIAAGAVVQQAKFYFPAGYNNPTYGVHYLGHPSRTDGRYVTIHPSQWQAYGYNNDHIRYVGDCAFGTAYRNAAKAGVYDVKFTRLPAYLCITPYCSDESIRNGAMLKMVRIYSDNAITGKFDIAQHGLDTNFATDLGTYIESGLGVGNAGFPVNNASINKSLNAIFIVMVPGVHTLTFEFQFTSPQQAGLITLKKTIDAYDYRPNTMTNIVANLTTSFDAENLIIDAGGSIATAKKQGSIQVQEDKDWDGSF